MSFGFEIIVIFLMLFINAIFAAYEMSLASLSRARLSTLCQLKKRGAEEAAYMKDRMEASLAVVQLGITFAGAIAAATGGAGSRETITPYFIQIGVTGVWADVISLVCIVIPLGIFTIIFAELVPKMFALNNRESVCLMLSPVMKWITIVAGPIVSLFEMIVKKIMGGFSKRFRGNAASAEDTPSLNELTAAVALARMSRLIGAQEEKIVLSAAHLSRHKVTDIMLPVADVSIISVTSTLSQALVRAHMDMHTRFPVCEKEGDPQTIIGYLNFKDIMNALKLHPENPSIQGITRPIKRIPGNTTLSAALSEMMVEKAHISMVVSDSKETIGMITLEDIIEELVGEIEDEFDRMPLHIQPCGAGWIIGGGVSMKLVASTLGIDLPVGQSSERIPTLAEWVVWVLGKPVEGGQIIYHNNISVIVRKLKRKKLAEAFVSRA